jgi:pimeloyl-ACP methyl ester carboxylesterase
MSERRSSAGARGPSQAARPTDTGRTAANGIELAYDVFGDGGGMPLILVMGLGVPRFGWDEAFCAMLVEQGFRVVRFDNRDVGESTHLHDAPRPDVAAAFAGDVSSASYRLEDMADDTAGLLDALRIDSAHVVGASMGGMIAQTLAIRRPERVRSVTSIMSTVAPAIGAPRRGVLPALLAPPARTLEATERSAVETWRLIGSPGFSFDEERVRALARRTWEAGYDPQGVARQLLAIQASGDRSEALAAVDVPTLVIHGEDDPLVQLPGGEATAHAIPGAQLDVIAGMGHDLPVELYERFAERIVALARHAESRGG